jgi:hypothetical protein
MALRRKPQVWTSEEAWVIDASIFSCNAGLIVHDGSVDKGRCQTTIQRRIDKHSRFAVTPVHQQGLVQGDFHRL